LNSSTPLIQKSPTLPKLAQLHCGTQHSFPAWQALAQVAQIDFRDVLPQGRVSNDREYQRSIFEVQGMKERRSPTSTLLTPYLIEDTVEMTQAFFKVIL
jgi:hypothetical protein